MAARPGPVGLSTQSNNSAAFSEIKPWRLTCDDAPGIDVTSKAKSPGLKPETVRTRAARSTPGTCAVTGVVAGEGVAELGEFCGTAVGPVTALRTPRAMSVKASSRSCQLVTGLQSFG